MAFRKDLKYFENIAGDSVIQKDLGDVIRIALHKPLKVKPESAGSLILLPIIGANPVTGFMIGVGGQYAFKVPRPEAVPRR